MIHQRWYFPVILLALATLWLGQSGTSPAPEPDPALIDSLKEAGAYAQVLPLVDQGLASSEARRDWLAFRNYTIDLGVTLTALHQYDQLNLRLGQNLHRLQAAGWADSVRIGRLWVHKAANHALMEDWPAAYEAYREAIRVFELRAARGYFPAYAFKNAAQILIRRQDFNQAQAYLEAALEADTARELGQSIYTQLANNHFWKNQLDAAWKWYQKGIESTSMGANFDASLYATGGAILLKQKNGPAARALYEKALQIYEKEPEETDNRLRCYTALAEIAQLQHNRPAAEKAYRAAEAAGSAYYRGKSREMAKLYCEWGDFYKNSGDRSNALRCYQNALIQSWPAFQSIHPADNPVPEDAPIELWAMSAAARKAALLLQQPGSADRENAARCFELAFSAADRLRRFFGKDETKLYLQQTNFNLQQEALRNLWVLYQEKRDSTWLYRLFDQMELGKATVLRDALRQQKALYTSGVPDSLLAREATLREYIVDQTLELAAADSLEKNAIRLRLQQNERHYQTLLTDLSRRFPRFNDYLKAGEQVSVQQVQQHFNDSTALFSFADAGNLLLCLVLRKNSIQAYAIDDQPALEQLLNRYEQLLIDRQAQQQTPDSIFACGHQLFRQLFPGNSLTTADRQLVIIPDGGLCFLPFESLCTQPHTGTYATAPWLLRDKTVRFHWSAALLNQAGSNTGTGILQLAPFVAAQRSHWSPLPFSGDEIPAHITAQKHLNNDATSTLLHQKAPEAAILHLSTHAGPDSSGQPGIQLADRALSLPEIYGARLHARLVALSACESGIGALARGEGVISLARAFAYAGAHNLIASLWQVNDQSTAAIFQHFYTDIAAGKQISTALTHAKTSYLNSEIPDYLKAPWYWAGLVLTGDDDQHLLQPPRPAWPFWARLVAGCGGIAVVFALFFRYFRLRRAGITRFSE